MAVAELKFRDLSSFVPVASVEVPSQGLSPAGRGVSVRETGVVSGLLREETLLGS